MTHDQPLALTPTSFRKDNVPEDEAADLAAQIFVLDLQEQLPGVGRLRDWTMAALAPTTGEVAVDVGCGAGAEVRRMAGLVGVTGRAVGVEPHAGLRAEAQVRAAAAGSSAEFVEADASTLPFEDGTVAVIRCERVFQHLTDPEAAVAEMARVLAPGGRVAITDSDWATAVVNVGDPDVVRRLNDATWQRMANPFAGRWLRTQLTRAGLVVDSDIGSSAVILPDELLADPQLLRNNTEGAVADGAITRDEADQLERDLVEAAEHREAFFAVTMFSVVGRVRPAAG